MFSDIHISYFRGCAREIDDCDSQASDKEEEAEVRPSMSKEHRDMMDKLFFMFPNKFVSNNHEAMPAAQKLFSLNNTTPLLKLDPIITGTWLDPPKSEGESSATGIWPENTIFPKGANPYVKGYEFRPPPRPTDISISDPNLKKRLEASKIKEANLNSTGFRTNESVKLANFSHPSSDVFQCGGLFDSVYSEELISCAIEFIPMLKN